MTFGTRHATVGGGGGGGGGPGGGGGGGGGEGGGGGGGGPPTVTDAVEELLAGFGSLEPNAANETDAVFKGVPATVAVAVTTTVASAPASRSPKSHVTFVPPAHVPLLVVTDSKAIPDGSGSTSRTPTARDGPWFVTLIL
jgi:hypothetical protein